LRLALPDDQAVGSTRGHMTLRIHRCAGACWLAASLMITSGCEDNGLLFTRINSNSPESSADAPVPNPSDLPSIPPEDDPDGAPGSGGSTAAGGGASGSSPGSGAASGGGAVPGGGAASGGGAPPGGAAPGGGAPTEPPGDDAVGGDTAGSGDGVSEGPEPEDPRVPEEPGASEYPPPNDDSCGYDCIDRGGRCQEGTCHFDCDAQGSCSDEQVICPPGVPCEVRCGDGACYQNVICAVGSECNVRCEGEGSCERQVICEGECQVTCSGRDSCRSGIGGAVALLELECSGVRSCAGTVSCEGQDCRLSCSGRESCGRVRTIAVDNNVACSGAGSCAGDLLCSGETCDIRCADDACESGIDCRAYRCDL
jgi:hypothetical protein